jgi:hypothetical protein
VHRAMRIHARSEESLMEGVHGVLENNSLVVSFAVSFRLDAVVTRWPPFITFDSSLPASQTASFCPFSHVWLRLHGIFFATILLLGGKVRPGSAFAVL